MKSLLWQQAQKNRTLLALRLEDEMSKRAKTNQQGGQGGVLLKQNSAEHTPVEIRKEIANLADVTALGIIELHAIQGINLTVRNWR